MIAIIIPIESECSSFSEVLSNVGFLTRKFSWKITVFRFIKKSNPLKANFLQKNPLAGMGETKRGFLLFWKTTSSFGCLHRNNNSYTGTSPRSRFLSSFKLTLGNEFPESVIHIDYERYYYSYRIRRLFIFQQAIRHVSPIPARDILTKNYKNFETALWNKKYKK